MRAFLLVLLLLAGVILSAAEPRWVLNNGRDALRLAAGQAEADKPLRATQPAITAKVKFTREYWRRSDR